MGVSGGVWECGKPERFSIISIPLFPLWVCRMYEKRCKEWRISK